jgi:hypothetical protein
MFFINVAIILVHDFFPFTFRIHEIQHLIMSILVERAMVLNYAMLSFSANNAGEGWKMLNRGASSAKRENGKLTNKFRE